MRVHVCVRTCARAPPGPGQPPVTHGGGGAAAERTQRGRGGGRSGAVPRPVPRRPSRRNPACCSHGDAVIPSSGPRPGPRSRRRLVALCSLTRWPPPRPPLPARLPRRAPGPGRSSGAGRAPLSPRPSSSPRRRRSRRRALPLPPLLPRPSPRPRRPQAALASSGGRGRRPKGENAAALADAALLRLPVGAGHRLLHVLGGRLRAGRGRGRRRRQEGEWSALPGPGPPPQPLTPLTPLPSPAPPAPTRPLPGCRPPTRTWSAGHRGGLPPLLLSSAGTSARAPAPLPGPPNRFPRAGGAPGPSALARLGRGRPEAAPRGWGPRTPFLSPPPSPSVDVPHCLLHVIEVESCPAAGSPIPCGGKFGGGGAGTHKRGWGGEEGEAAAFPKCHVQERGVQVSFQLFDKSRCKSSPVSPLSPRGGEWWSGAARGLCPFLSVLYLWGRGGGDAASFAPDRTDSLGGCKRRASAPLRWE